MATNIEQLMNTQVVTLTPHQSIGHAREVLSSHKISAAPIVGPEQQVLGIITDSDLIEAHSMETPISAVMSKKVYTVSPYSKVSLAARMMRNHHIHHLVVTDEKKLMGIVSSYDLLKLVEDHAFVMKNPSTPQKKRGSRAKAEHS